MLRKETMDGAEPAWKRYLTDYNEGLGLVYERFVLNDFLMELVKDYGVQTVLEAPLFGMAGVSGINSVAMAQAGCHVTLVDDNPERLNGVRRIWGELELEGRFVKVDDWSQLPFDNRSFDLCWEWAGLWYLDDPSALLQELVRTSRRLVFVAMPNRAQIGYLMRKYLLEPDFVHHVDEKWADIRRIRTVLETAGVRIVRQGVLDVPPWPDTVMPAAEVLKKLGLRSSKLEQRFSGDSWEWNTMAYYLRRQPDLRQRVMKYAFLDRVPLPWQIKAIWAHHRYLLGVREN